MRFVALIPARFSATRFPGKLMQLLGNKTVIQTTYDNVVASSLFNEVYVVTDSKEIFDEITGNGGLVIMSKKPHESGSDRIAEAIENIQADVIINVQGDEPFADHLALKKLADAFKTDATVQVASLMHEVVDEQSIQDPNSVKVVVDKNYNALYFSRSVIPYNRNKEENTVCYRHIGVYAYRKQALINFTKWPVTRLENAEKLEQLRYLENGVKIKMVITNKPSIGIDTPQDLEQAKQFLLKKR